MKMITCLAAAISLGGAIALPPPAQARDRDPFGFYGFYYGQCPRDPAMCRAKPGCICDRNLEENSPNVEREKRSDAGPIILRIRSGGDAGPLIIRIKPVNRL